MLDSASSLNKYIDTFKDKGKGTDKMSDRETNKCRLYVTLIITQKVN